MTITGLLPGDILCCRGGGWAGFLIRLGAAFRGRPNLSAHVAIMHHYTDGVPWGLEGKPGGVGWVDLRKYTASRWTLSNIDQPKTAEQREKIQTSSEALLGTPYDWDAIAADAFESLGIRSLFQQNWKKQGAPGHLVCSSFAAYLYHAVGLARPERAIARYITPADWAQFCITRGWE